MIDFLPCQFWGVRQGASNISCKKGDYTLDQFRQMFPQFFTEGGEPLFPSSVFDMFAGIVNNAITEDKFGESHEYAAGLYMAHLLSVYLKTYAESSATPQQAANSGALVGVVKSATLGDSSVTYDTSAITSATSEWGNLNSTQYGQQLATMARLVGMAGSYVI